MQMLLDDTNGELIIAGSGIEGKLVLVWTAPQKSCLITLRAHHQSSLRLVGDSCTRWEAHPLEHGGSYGGAAW